MPVGWRGRLRRRRLSYSTAFCGRRWSRCMQSGRRAVRPEVLLGRRLPRGLDLRHGEEGVRSRLQCRACLRCRPRMLRRDLRRPEDRRRALRRVRVGLCAVRSPHQGLVRGGQVHAGCLRQGVGRLQRQERRRMRGEPRGRSGELRSLQGGLLDQPHRLRRVRVGSLLGRVRKGLGGLRRRQAQERLRDLADQRRR